MNFNEWVGAYNRYYGADFMQVLQFTSEENVSTKIKRMQMGKPFKACMTTAVGHKRDIIVLQIIEQAVVTHHFCKLPTNLRWYKLKQSCDVLPSKFYNRKKVQQFVP